MKLKNFMYVALLGALLGATACSSENLPGETEDLTGESGAHYLSVSIVSNNANGTRAEGDVTSGDPDDPNSKYEEGSAAENKVDAVRFYFFDSDGKAAAVVGGSQCYVDKTSEKVGQDMPNVEKILDAVIVINTKEGDKLPAKMVAVINPDKAVLPTMTAGTSTIDDLRGLVQNFVPAAAADDTKGNFVMSNATYSDEKTPASEIYATDIPASALQKSEELAKNNPVKIYVERTMAKVRAYLGSGITPDAGGYIALTDGVKNIEVDGKQVYLHITGWNLTADTDKGYLGKHVDTSWTNTALDFTWNYAPYFRSYWAQMPAASYNTTVDGAANDKVNQKWYTFNEIGNTALGKDNSIYTNENTLYNIGATYTAGLSLPNADVDTPVFATKVIIGGELGTLEAGVFKPLELCKWANQDFVGETALKTALLNALKANGMIYAVTTHNDGTVASSASLTDADVVFKSAIAAGQAQDGENNKGRYYAYLQMSDTGKAKTWYMKNYGQGEMPAASDKVVDPDQYLVNQLGSLKIYKSGLTYYYFPIQHLRDSHGVGHYGVVRNHIYDCQITAITGLGTPVYDPEEVVYPEKPVEETIQIAAQINIESWRLVSHDYKLEW